MPMHDEEDKATALDPYAHPTGVASALAGGAPHPGPVDAGYARSAPAPEATAPMPTAAKKPANVDPYSNPTDFRSFEQTYDANAGSAKAGAAHLQQGVDDAAAKARKTLGEDESGLTKALGTARDGSLTEGWSGPDAYSPNGNTYTEYANATQKAANLGSTAGVQESMGPGTSMFSAALTRHAGGAGFQATQDRYAGLGGETGAAAARGTSAIGDAKTARQGQIDRVAVDADAQKRDIEQQESHRQYQDFADEWVRTHETDNDRLRSGGGTATAPTYDEWLKMPPGGK